MSPCPSRSASPAASSLLLMASSSSDCLGPHAGVLLDCALSLSSLTSKPSGSQAGMTTKQIWNLTFPHSFHCYNSGLCHRSLSPGILQSPPMRSPWHLLTFTVSSPQSSQSALYRPHVRSYYSSTQQKPCQSSWLTEQMRKLL